MSEKNDIITITPPAFVGVGNMKEVFVCANHLCGHCRGNGFFGVECKRERVQEVCPVCNGSGMLDAVVTIEWKPSKNGIEQLNGI